MGKTQLMDENRVEKTMARIAHEIIEKNEDLHKICLVGIKRRGLPLAYMLQKNIRNFTGTEVPVGYLDISLYRDDLSELFENPKTTGSLIPVDVRNYTIILVDDVIFTGRTIRAAIDAVFTYGRPAAIQLAVLIDRGHRELPIRPDYVGKNIPTSLRETVNVSVAEIDGSTGVDLQKSEQDTL